MVVKRRWVNQGFTLVELMVSMAATAILALTVSLILVMPWQAQRTNERMTQLRRDAMVSMQMMTHDIRTSSSGNLIDPSNFGENQLILLPNDVRSSQIEYRRIPTTHLLVHYIDGVEQGALAEGVQLFSTTSTNGTGIVLHLRTETADGEMVMDRQTFISVRN